MKVWTARYHNPNVAKLDAAKVRITVGAPRFGLRYKITDNIPELAPFGELFDIHDRKVFTPGYFRRLDNLGIDWIRARLDRASQAEGGKDVVLLCFERVDQGRDWCHRLVLAEWVKNATGEIWEEIEEAADLSEPRKHASRKRTVPN